MRKIEAVSVCVNYSKYLKFTAERNRKHFDRWIIVTTPSDFDTIDLCKKYDLECVQYNGFSDRKGKFQKSKGINEGLRKIKFDDFYKNDTVLHIDSDIILPDDFSSQINAEKIRVENYLIDTLCDYSIYGINRAHVKDPVSNEKIDELFEVIKKYDLRGDEGIYCPGFFQMFTKQSVINFKLNKNKMIYPEICRHAGFDDALFPKIFYAKISLQMTAIHLGEKGKNWNGI